MTSAAERPTSSSTTTGTAGAEDSAVDVATALDVDRALDRLSVRQRAVFDLHYKKGMTHPEIAEALELPLGTIKSDLVRGLEQLKAWLGGDDE